MMVDVVILSNCTSGEYFDVNRNCVESLLASEPEISFNIIIVESNPEFRKLGLSYGISCVTIISPNEPFHFNRFLNIGLAATTCDWVVFSNNDVTFHSGWFRRY